MVTELPNVNLRFAIERQGALPGRTSLLINRQSTNANRKSFIQPGAKPAAKKPIRHGAWLTEVVKQRRPETATFPCGKPSRAALGEPSPEIYSTAGRDSSANIGDFPLQNALNNRKRGICASRVGSTGTKPDRVGSACSDRICGEKRGGDRPWSSPRWIGVPGGGSPSVTGPARTGKVPSHTSVSGAGLPEAQSTGPRGGGGSGRFSRDLRRDEVLARPTRDHDLAAGERPAPLRLPLTHVVCRRGVPTRRGDRQLLSKPLVSSRFCFRPHRLFLSHALLHSDGTIARVHEVNNVPEREQAD